MPIDSVSTGNGLTWTSDNTITTTVPYWYGNTTTTTSSGGSNYINASRYWTDPAITDENTIRERAEILAKDMVADELRAQYRVKERGWGNVDGCEYFRNTLIECNGKKAVVISTGYKGTTITVNSYMAKYEKPRWVADIQREIGKELESFDPIEGDTNHDKRVAEIVEEFRKDCDEE